jgi:hypothetical protein
VDEDVNILVTVNAGAGADTLTVTASKATLNGGDGDDIVYTGDSGDYVAELGVGANMYLGGDSTDYVTLTSGGTDTIHLGGGDDTVDALYDFYDDDFIYGDDGYDTLMIWAGLSRSKAHLDNIDWIEEV